MNEQVMQVLLDIDGTSTRMNPFVQKFFVNTIMGMITSLEGIKENPKCITLSLTRKEKEDEKS